MCIEIDKCIFDQKSASFLGCMVDGQTIQIDLEKAKAVVNRPRPTNQKKTQQILGLWNFHRTFNQGYTQRDAPISDLLKGNGKDFRFGGAQEAAFLKIVTMCTSGRRPFLGQFDINRPSLIETDATDFAM